MAAADEEIKCIACGCAAEKIGEVPFSRHFLTREFNALDTGDLYRCATCGLWYKYPYLSESFIAESYAEAPAGLAWSNGESRSDFNLAKRLLVEKFSSGADVLDLGCYMGEFLRFLPAVFQKFGVEPNRQAAAEAGKAGIQIVGSSHNDLGNVQFDAVTLFDVFEHLREPLKTLDMLFDHLRPGGILVVGTGIADYPLFRVAGSKYNYVCLPEHVCFLTRKFAATLGRRYGAGIRLISLSRNHGSVKMYLRALAIDTINFPVLLVRKKSRIARIYSSPKLMSIAGKGILPFWPAADHALLVVTKPL